MKHKIDYSKLDEKAFKARVKLLSGLKSQLEAMVKDAVNGSVSARASAAKQLVEVDAELVVASQTRRIAPLRWRVEACAHLDRRIGCHHRARRGEMTRLLPTLALIAACSAPQCPAPCLAPPGEWVQAALPSGVLTMADIGAGRVGWDRRLLNPYSRMVAATISRVNLLGNDP